MQHKRFERYAVSTLAIASFILLAGCTTPSSSPTSAPSVVDLQVILTQAQAARDAGDTSRAISLLQSGAKSYPTNKQPWLKLAQIHFNSHQYSEAILAAEEVLQRDASDATALSILSVSGLRISANSLQQLRKLSAVSDSTRSEAETLTRTIREAVGEDVLLPGSRKPTGGTTVNTPRRPPNAGIRNTPVVPPASGTSTPPVPPVGTINTKPPSSSVPANTGGRTPFDVFR